MYFTWPLWKQPAWGSTKCYPNVNIVFWFWFFSTTKSKLCQNLEFPFMFEQIPCISKSKPWIFTTNKFWFSFYFGVPQSFISCSYSRTKYSVALTPIFLLDQILSAEFFQKFPNSFGWENWDQLGYFDTLPSSLSLIKSCPSLSDPVPDRVDTIIFMPHNQWIFISCSTY